MLDDLGREVHIPAGGARRIVSLVPSLTEAFATSAPHVLSGATDWCSHPADLDVPRVRGTKNPNLHAIADIAPDVVIANQEENRKLDVERLTGRGIQVWVTHITTVDEAFYSMRRLFTEVISSPVPGWLTEAQDAWSAPSSHSPLRVAVPIWRDPWMVIGASTFSGDLLSRLGLHNIFADAEHNPDGARYPHTDLELIDTDQVDAVLLPDEPYEFSATDGPEAFATAPTALVEGRLITWYGPSLLEARALRDDVDAKLNARP